MSKTYQFFAGYFKQGDDLAHLLKSTKTPQQALKKWAQALRASAKDIDRLAKLFAGKKLTIDADTHAVDLQGDEKTLEKAVKLKLLDVLENDDDEETGEVDLDNDAEPSETEA